jgi:PilZ domain
MQVVPFPARQARAYHRHEPRSLTHVMFDGNTGVVRNLSSRGLGVQAICPVRPQQRVHLRIILRSPRLKVDAEGQVVWTDSSNFCGIAFVDLPARVSRQIDEWIFSNLIEIAQRQSEDGVLNFGRPAHSASSEEDVSDDDGLTLSSTAREPIRLETNSVSTQLLPDRRNPLGAVSVTELNWLSRPLSPRTIAWAVDSLLVVVALLLFILIFLSIVHELPSLPLTMGSVLTVGIFILLVYRGLFGMFGGGTLGDRLTRAASPLDDKTDEAMRFR